MLPRKGKSWHFISNILTKTKFWTPLGRKLGFATQQEVKKSRSLSPVMLGSILGFREGVLQGGIIKYYEYKIQITALNFSGL
jgi:hypothetical protein